VIDVEMPTKFKISVVLVGKSLKVTIPKELCEQYSLKKGDIISMWADNSHILMEKGS
jgi:bifunctional DNA-binding transcriptional regulator/antitoxin component of YhaV-PrlF toxin-antitoxin module